MDIKIKKVMCIYFFSCTSPKMYEGVTLIQKGLSCDQHAPRHLAEKHAHLYFILLQTDMYNLCLKVIGNFCFLEVEWLNSLFYIRHLG